MRRACLALSAAVATLLAAVGFTMVPAAAAVPAYSLSTDATVLYPGCGTYHLSYSTSTPADRTTWDLSIVDELSRSVGSIQATGAAGVYDLVLCGNRDRTGRYDVYGPLVQCDSSGTSCSRTDVQYYFLLRGPHTTVTLAASTTRPRFNGVVTFTMRCQVEAPDGYAGIEGARIRLEALFDGKWRRLDSSKAVTDSRGTAKKRYRWNVHGRVRLRAVCEVRSGISRKEKASDPLTIRTR